MFTLVAAPSFTARWSAPQLDARLAVGEYPFGSPRLALRATQLVSRRTRRLVAEGIEHALSDPQRPGDLCCAAPVDRAAVDVGRPALEQLARALRQGEHLRIRGAALAHLLLTDPESPLFGARYPEELYERAREALLAL